MQARGFDFAVLALGVAAVSTAALFIREADAPALVIAAYRLTLASLPLLLVAGIQRRSIVPSEKARLGLTLLAGVCLAFHFAFWIASVKQTSIITSVVLVTAQPLFVALASGFLLRERVSGGAWLGIGIAAAGAAVMVGDDLGSGADTLVGDLFAILGAIFAAAYFLIGRSLRLAGAGWLPYVSLAYSTSALVLIAMAAIAGEAFFGYSERTYGFLVLLALVPQLIGHTALNRSLGYLPAVAVTIAVLGEPVGATLLGAIFLSETPTPVEVTGALLVLSGVYVGLHSSFRGSSLIVDSRGGDDG